MYVIANVIYGRVVPYNKIFLIEKKLNESMKSDKDFSEEWEDHGITELYHGGGDQPLYCGSDLGGFDECDNITINNEDVWVVRSVPCPFKVTAVHIKEYDDNYAKLPEQFKDYFGPIGRHVVFSSS